MPKPSHASAMPSARALREDRLLQGLVGAYALAWAVAAVAPVDRKTWLLENILVVGGAGLLAATRRRLAFSRFSYVLFFWFGMLHIVGAHYTYSAVPVGTWLSETLGFGRNHYDRFVHFAFGLLLGYPIRELVLRVLHVHRAWSYAVPVAIVLALSSLYELMEAAAARIVDPAVGMAFVGAQGDIWDSQKDMGLALLGVLLVMAATAVHRRLGGREPYVMSG